ncbi:MAG TPA: hypothetical protein PKD72_15970, partial [Gemmatales bacterium]|nr:hypothetical protein [Gemmatales bacterium]
MLRSRTILPTLLGVFLAGLLWASDKTPVTSNAKLFNSLESETRIMSDIYYLTSEECVARLKQAGLQPAGVEGTYFQPFDFKLAPPRLGEKNSLSLNLGSEKVALDAKEFQVMGAGNAGLVENAPVAFAGYGIQSEAPSYNDYEELNAEGKVVIILRRTPRQPDNADPKFKDDLATLTSKINLATEQKAQAILLVNDSSVKEADELVRFNFAGTRAKKETPPVFHVKRSVVNKLLAEAGSETLEELENKIASDLKPRSRVLEKVSLSLQADINRDGFKINNIIAT